MSGSEDFPLNNLNDELLIEILRRLPTSKSVLAGCLLVCKRWHSLICSSYFVSQFKEHHRNKNINSCYPAYQSPPCVFIQPMDDHKLFLVTDDSAIFDSPGYTLEFLPEEREHVSVEASCNDLLLCKVDGVFRNCVAFYVCNPITRQWFRFPDPSESPKRRQPNIRGRLSITKFGLVYDPIYCQEKKYECRFRVVCIANDDSMHIYSSENKHWNEFPPLVEEYRPCYDGNVVALGGRLYWCNAKVDCVVAYDPFSNEAILIDGSDEYKSYGTDIPCLGICQGTLRLIKLKKSYVGNIRSILLVHHLSIWDLKDYESKRPTLKHRSFLNCLDSSLLFGQPIGSHPTEDDVVYMCSGNGKKVLSCKIQGEDLEVVGNTNRQVFQVVGNTNRQVFPIKNKFVFTAMLLPWWPTPISNANV